MQPWTREQLLRFAPAPKRRSEHDDSADIHLAYVAVLLDSWPLLDEAGINTPLRVAHFMAIVGHETGGLTIGREACTWSYERMCQLWPQRFQPTSAVMRARYMACRGDEEKLAELAYGGWSDLGKRLGNTEPGDGWTYRGGGPFQDTGRARYREAGAAIGADLEREPDMIEDPRIAIRVVIWAWQRYRMSEMADRNYLRAIQNCVNRGNPFAKADPNGWPSRQRWFDRAWAVWGIGQALPSPLDIGVGAQGPEVLAVQNRLRELGYQCGNPDSLFGPECRRAVAAFKADWKAHTGQELDPDEMVGAATRAALATAEPIKRPDREKMSVADLAAAGSTEVIAGQRAKFAGTLLATLGAAGGVTQPLPGPMKLTETAPAAPQTNPTQTLQDTVGWIPGAKALLVPVIEAIQWAIAHWWWVAVIFLGVWMYAKGIAVIKARLQAARRGLNLWR